MVRVENSYAAASLTAQTQLARSLSSLDEASLRLATAKRINRGSDDPAGLVALESLRSELNALDEAAESAGRAAALVQVADSALDQASEILLEVRGHVVAAANGELAPGESSALQHAINLALGSLDRLGVTTRFGGQRLFDPPSAIVIGLAPNLEFTAKLELVHLNSGSLGGDAGSLSDLRSGGSASLAAGDLERSLEIVDAARAEILDTRARAGAFQRYTLEASQALAEETSIQLSAAASQIGDADVALEHSRLTRALIQREFGLRAVRSISHSQSLLGSLFG